jgi:hypothetical protein
MKPMNTKNVLLMISTLLSAAPAFAGKSLDGRTYCRTVVADGMFGQPAGEVKHCLSFSGGFLTDDDTFGGNPPTTARYSVVGNKVVCGSDAYELSADQATLTRSTGIAKVDFFLE